MHESIGPRQSSMMGMRTLGIVVLADEAYYIPRCDLSNRPG